MTTPEQRTLLRDVEVAGVRADVLLAGDRIAEIRPDLEPGSADAVIDGGGGALIPGLHDHHIHLLATAALTRSVRTGPPHVRTPDDLARALADADERSAPGEWLRGTGYHQSVAGDLDRHDLDALVAHRPVRIQHRSGARWTLNTAAIDALDLADEHRPGLQRDDSGAITGRIHRLDDWLRDRLPPQPLPDLATLGRQLASYGVTGVTDPTPFRRPDDLLPLAAAVETGALPFTVVALGGIELVDHPFPPSLGRGPVKLIVDDGAYPPLDDLSAAIGRAHAAGRPVAIHCVTRTALVLALAAWDVVGSVTGDRIEHGAVIPTELYPSLRDHGLTVVTQPAFIAERGDDYLREVDGDDLDHLYPCASLLADGIAVGASSDGPYTDPDPWAGMRAACLRRTSTGEVLGGDERVSPRVALGLYLGPAEAPGGAHRTVSVGAPADLCLLDVPLDAALADLGSHHVRLTISRGRITHGA